MELIVLGVLVVVVLFAGYEFRKNRVTLSQILNKEVSGQQLKADFAEYADKAKASIKENADELRARFPK